MQINRNHPAFRENVAPFYDTIMQGLSGFVDGEHFWDAVDPDAIFHFLYRFPGFPEFIKGRDAYMDWFGGYSNLLKSGDNLHVYHDPSRQTVILEYQIHGWVPSTNKAYDIAFCSIITIRDRKIIYWKDYSDSLGIMNVLTKD